MTKYKNKKVVLNGITFDSQEEARRYRDLSLLERVGEIESLELQKLVDAAFRVLSQLNALDDEAHKRWKREACMFSQGESLTNVLHVRKH